RGALAAERGHDVPVRRHEVLLVCPDSHREAMALPQRHAGDGLVDHVGRNRRLVRCAILRHGDRAAEHAVDYQARRPPGVRGDPGDPTVKWPGPALPAATATTMFAWSRLSTAIVRRSWIPFVLPPRLMLATSKPSA